MASVESAEPEPGLCSSCRHVRRLRSARGSVFFLCRRSASDEAFPRYPTLPVHQCVGYEPVELL